MNTSHHLIRVALTPYIFFHRYIFTDKFFMAAEASQIDDGKTLA